MHTATDPQKRFKGMGPVLVVDAVAGTEMEQVVIYDDLGWEIYSSATVARRNRSIMAVGSGRVPLTVRAVWRKGAGWDNVKKLWNDGVIAGDYSVPVAKRIPDDILRNIREHGGNLRLKFRLKPDGILFGWDIERAAPLGDVSIFEMPGGDFLETRY
ncbi:hypothetical protein NX773_00580 [Massilia solisilvae]|uniref:Phage tail protein n=1 Tax=Massilia solisilvae TaxID=1811225 RepID=A0ABT2BDS0_9BURK|nr:hypothetical protein [Massilia solisilvae]MCS0606659.1 hypothetical protein [Massilia solisilvae]